MRPSTLGLAAWIAAGTTILASCSQDSGDSGPSGDGAGAERTSGPLLPGCRLELATRGQPERVRFLDLDGDGRDELYAVTRGAAPAGEPARGSLHVWRDLFEPARVVDLPDYLLGPEPFGDGLVLASRASSELIHLDANTGEVRWREALDDVPRALATGRLDEGGPEVVALALRGGGLVVRSEGEWHGADFGLELVTTLLVEPGAIWIGSQANEQLQRNPVRGLEDLERVQVNLAQMSTFVPLGGIPRRMGRFDLDGDGSAEFLVAGGDHQLWTVLEDEEFGDGATTSLRVGSIPIGLAPLERGLAVLAYGELSYRILRGGEEVHRAYAGQDAWDIASGDLDGDGVLDLAIANRGAHRVSVVLGDGAGGWREARQLPTFRGPHKLGSIDLTGDGRRALVSVDALDDRLTLLPADGGPRRSAALDGIVQGLVSADLDGEAGEEVLLSIEQGTAGRLELWKPGPEGLQRVLQVDLPGRPGDLALLADGSVAVADVAGGLWLVPWSSAGPGAPTHLDLDGIPVALAPLGDGLAVALGPPGARQAIEFVVAGAVDRAASLDLAGIAPRDLCAYDHDGDGILELALLLQPQGQNGPGRLALLRAQGGAWRPFHSELTGLRAYALAAGDLNGDGRDELVVGAQNSHHVNLWSPVGERLQRYPDLGVGRGVLDVAVVDLDGDGRPEVVCANNFSNEISVVPIGR